jgi:acyl-CoA thioesterase-1
MHYFEDHVYVYTNYMYMLKEGWPVYKINRQHGLKLFAAIGFVVFLLNACGGNIEKKPAADTPSNTTGDSAAASVATSDKNIIFFGNSITAGYGLEQPTEAFPALIQNRIDSLNLSYKVINAGLSGETTAGGKNRIDWILKQPVSVFVLELGGNDGLRGIPISETRQNLQTIIDRVKAKNPDVKIILAGMHVPPNMGQKYATEFHAVYRELADKNNTALIPFILEGVGGVQELNQPDGIHPTPGGHRVVAENVWAVLKNLL